MTQIDPSGMFGISPGGSQLGGIGSLGNFSLNLGGAEAEGSIGGLMSMHESLHDLALNPQDPVTGLHPDACGAMAETAQKIANIAVKNAGGDFGKALTEFDYEFGTLYAGRPLRSWDDAMVLQRGADTEAAFGLLGESGFDPKFQEGRVSNDQTHHFVTYFSGGLNPQDGILKIHRALEDQPADVRLGDAAQLFGHAVRNDPERLKMIGTSIQIRVCDDKKRPVPKFER